MSCDRNVGPPPLANCIHVGLNCIILANTFQKGLLEPRGVPARNSRGTKYARLMPSAWMERIEAIIGQFSQVQISLVSIGQ